MVKLKVEFDSIPFDIILDTLIELGSMRLMFIFSGEKLFIEA